MIGRLSGIVAAIGEDCALIDVHGIGYVALAGARTLSRLELNAPTVLFIETHVREDAIKLYGFLSEEERAWFVHLQTAPGVGAKVALNILDALGAEALADAIALQDKTAIARANGVGPKLAARIAGELAGKPPPRGFLAAAPSARIAAAPSAGARAEALSALINLGIDRERASRAIAAAAQSLGEGAETAALIKAGLKEVQA